MMATKKKELKAPDTSELERKLRELEEQNKRLLEKVRFLERYR